VEFASAEEAKTGGEKLLASGVLDRWPDHTGPRSSRRRKLSPTSDCDAVPGGRMLRQAATLRRCKVGAKRRSVASLSVAERGGLTGACIEWRKEPNMTILQIEHAISDFDAWKRAFDSGWTLCAARRRGLRRYRVFRPIDDPNYVKVDLEFDSSSDAESIQTALRDLWGSGLAAPALVGNAQAQIVEAVENEEYSDRPRNN
jgi:hypothetical protein